LFVVEAGRGRARLVRGALRRLQLSRSPVIGSALTKFDHKTAGYGYGYGYGHDETNAATEAESEVANDVEEPIAEDSEPLRRAA
jgi:hypothetical protein